MLEQASNFEALKSPYITDPQSPPPRATTSAATSPASSGKSHTPESTPDFKSVLEKSLNAHNTATSTPPNAYPNTHQSTQATAKATPPKALPDIPSKMPQLAGTGLDSSHATPNLPDSLASLLQKGAQGESTPSAQSVNTQSMNTGTDTPSRRKTLSDMAKQEPQETFLSKITQNKLDAAQSAKPSTTPNAQTGSGQIGGLQGSTTGNLTGNIKESTKAEATKASLLESKAPTPESTSAQGGAKSSDSKSSDNKYGSDLASLSGASAAHIAQALADSPAQTSPNATKALSTQGLSTSSQAKSSLQNAIGESSTGVGAKAGMAAGAKTLGDVVGKAQELGLNPSKAEFSQASDNGADEFKNSLQARTGMRQTPASSDGIKQFFDKQDEISLRGFFSMISAANALDAAARRSNRANRIEYAIESKSEKIAIINRGRTLPKNITESRLKNERQEKVFEQIQRDLIAGRELDLEQIRADLFASRSEAKPLSQPAQRLTSAGATTTALVLGAQEGAQEAAKAGAREALKELQKSSPKSSPKSMKDPREATKAKAPQPASQETSKEMGKEAGKDAPILRAELESSAPKDPARAMPSELGELPELETLEQEKLPKTAKQAQSEQKPESKLESKLATSAALGASAMKPELSKPQIREMIASFVNQFEQEVKKFKPPMNKISLELNPKELGNIELTITQRGNSLHISVVSNPQAISIFAQNQLDLRQNLIAQGFEGIDLSFTNSGGGNGSNSSNGGGNQSGDNPQDRLDSGVDSKLMARDSSEASMEITLPLYA